MNFVSGANLFSCWDGKNLDSPNHKDHVAYPVDGPSSFATTGTCPSSHPVKIPQVMLEVGICTCRIRTCNNSDMTLL